MVETPQQKEEKEKSKGEPPLKTYSKYSAIAVQMVVIILVSVWGGKKLDELAGTESPIFTAILALLGVVAAIYTSIKDLIK
ncbi:MAG: AtpZ/AtpI family protein [Bacteroidales bacterium]|nr:AtpZ/AtpI family protein [Bacteroidales bacterium]